jgi:hypothetical protein
MDPLIGFIQKLIKATTLSKITDEPVTKYFDIFSRSRVT